MRLDGCIRCRARLTLRCKGRMRKSVSRSRRSPKVVNVSDRPLLNFNRCQASQSVDTPFADPIRKSDDRDRLQRVSEGRNTGAKDKMIECRSVVKSTCGGMFHVETTVG